MFEGPLVGISVVHYSVSFEHFLTGKQNPRNKLFILSDQVAEIHMYRVSAGWRVWTACWQDG